MFNNKRTLLFVLFSILLSISIFILLRYYTNKNNENLIISIIPTESYFTLKIKDINTFNFDLQNNEILLFFKKNQEISNQIEELISIISVLSESESFGKIIEKSELYVSIVQSHDNPTLFVSLNTPKNINSSRFFKNFEELSNKVGANRISNIQYENIKKVSFDNQDWYLAVLKNAILVTQSLELATSAFKNYKLKDKDTQNDIYENLNSKSNYFVFYQNEGLKKFVNSYFCSEIVPLNLLPPDAVIEVLLENNNINFIFIDKSENIKSFDNNQLHFGTFFNFINSYSYKRFDNLKNYDNQLFSKYDDFFYDTYFEVMFPFEATEKDIFLMQAFKLKKISESKKIIHQESHKIEFSDLKISKIDTFQLRLFSDNIFYSNFLRKDELVNLKYGFFYQDYLIVTNNIYSIEKFFAQVSNNATAEYKQDNFIHKVHLPAFYPMFIANLDKEKNQIWKNNYHIVSSLSEWNFSLNKSNLLELNIGFDSLSLLKYLDIKFVSRFNEFVKLDFDSLINFPKNHKTIIEGRNVFYYQDLGVKAEGFYAKNLARGVWRFFYPSGNLQALIEFKNNLANGKAIFYSDTPHKNIEITCSFVNGIKQGAFINFFDNGKPSIILAFNNGDPSSRLKMFNRNTTLFAEAELGVDLNIVSIDYFTLNGELVNINNLSNASNILLNYETFISYFTRNLKVIP